MKTIPLNSLVIVDPTAVLPTPWPQDHELVGFGRETHALVGPTMTMDISAIVVQEMRHRAALKLSLGERVILLDVPREHWTGFVELARLQGCSLVYLLGDQTERPVCDAQTMIILPDSEPYEMILSDRAPTPASLHGKWAGVTVLGDVHGI